MAKKAKADSDLSTEEKIKEAARKVFTRKGYAATRTRDIAEEADINLALLNYYFRSKGKLFEIIMAEKMQQFFGVMEPMLNNTSTTLQNKIERITSAYIDLITHNPDLPLFILSEIRNSPEHFLKITGKASALFKSVLIKQIQEKKPDRNPLHFLLNLMSMCVFPFVMNPVLKKMGAVDEKTFAKMMKERKKLIPVWVKSMLEAE